ncbi:MAG: 1-(5-phosphoribosyl)-5-[(5-phosphoribosylamino)methylideneamino]imidazole-4-carboxamide isomerase [Chloroflexota bacterium]|jgi:phosphoribosylformimino-5-aminoimidazole carboxamide ribotide isomerase
MDFQVIPAVDIRGGRCVRLYQGQYEQETVFSEDPVAMALRWQEEGACRIHVVDLDGALTGKPENLDIVREMAKVLSIPICLGGGMRRLQSIAQVLDAGVDRVILGTAAIETPELIKEACELYGDHLAVALDARNGMVMTHGWTESSGESALDLAMAMVNLGAKRLIYTDITRDGTLTEPNFDAASQLMASVDVPVVVSGGVSRAEHLVRIRNLGAEGAIVGRALYTGAITMAELKKLGLLSDKPC